MRRIQGHGVSRNPLFRALNRAIDLPLATWMAQMIGQILHGYEWNVDRVEPSVRHDYV